MGNICSRSSNEPDAFARPGRVVGTTPSQSDAAPRASAPARASWKNTPGRTLGERSPAAAQGGSDEARSNAAIAAQKRAETMASGNKGKLGSKLAVQKAKTQTQTLNEVSQTERAARDADYTETARQWN
ncbi:uncharacterized protein N7459_003529 [Penicillium hispanicum]|uniref:uncharacterized protein n=1 Tax=Penicillium hispanicum TaxID=1080232 RepID=UPI0025402505|nr:uncharacterized protein N7459_003529 [Penicillium hispanicum]KAJ5587764.1 hypothetical protein N7459_003529 [Penicillium hispanicum]